MVWWWTFLSLDHFNSYNVVSILFFSKLLDRVITVEYAIRDDDDDKRNGYSPDRRGRDTSPDGRYGRGRSLSPYRRGRGSPDYGHGSNPTSRVEPRGSPKYERNQSPSNGRYDRFVWA